MEIKNKYKYKLKCLFYSLEPE